MKVKELIEILKTKDPELPILIAGDEEGYRFYPFCNIDESHYRLGIHGIEVYCPEDVKQMRAEAEEFNGPLNLKNEPLNLNKVIVFWP